MNPYIHLPIDEYDEEDVIISDNQCRNKKKLLQKKIDKYEKNPSIELLKNIKILKCNIREYENRNVVYKKVSKNKLSITNKYNDTKILNQLSKHNQKIKHKKMIKDQQIDKLWRKSNGSPKWSPKVHKLFPLHDKRGIKLLLLAKNNENCIFSILPNEIIDNILSNIQWDWFYVEKKKHIKKKKVKNRILN